jgi:hypothetical protein
MGGSGAGTRRCTKMKSGGGAVLHESTDMRQRGVPRVLYRYIRRRHAGDTAGRHGAQNMPAVPQRGAVDDTRNEQAVLALLHSGLEVGAQLLRLVSDLRRVTTASLSRGSPQNENGRIHRPGLTAASSPCSRNEARSRQPLIPCCPGRRCIRAHPRRGAPCRRTTAAGA